MIGRAVILLLALATAPATARAFDGAIDVVPDSAGVVIRVKNFNEARTKVRNFAKQVGSTVVPIADQWIQGAGAAISNAALRGLDPDGDWWVAVLPISDGDPEVVFAVSATDVNALKTAVGPSFQFVVKDNLVFYSEDATALEKIQERLAGKGASIASVIDKESSALLERSDLSAFINVRVLREVYAAQLEEAREQVDAFLEQMQAAAPELPGTNMQAAFEMYGQLFHGLLQLVEDSQSLALGLSISEQSIGLEQYLSVAPGSKTDKFLQTHEPSEMHLLSSLPANQLAYAGFHGDMNSLAEWAMKFSTRILADEELRAQWHEMMEGFAEFKFGSYVGSFSLGDLREGAVRATVVMEVDPADKFREFSRKTSKAVGEFSYGGFSQTVELNADAETYGEHSADVITITQMIDETIDPTGLQLQFYSALFGPEGMMQRIVYLDDKVVQTVGGGRAAMQKALEALERDPAEDEPSQNNEELERTRASLARKANILLFVDLPGAAADVLRLVADSGAFPLPVNAQMIDKLKLRRSYVGISAKVEPHALRIRANIPATQIAESVKLGLLIQSLMQEPQF